MYKEVLSWSSSINIVTRIIYLIQNAQFL